MDDPQGVADQITEAGLTIKDASFLLGINRQTLSKALKGEPVTEVIRYQILKKLPRALQALDAKNDDFDALEQAKYLPNPRREVVNPNILEAVKNFRRALQSDPDLAPATYLRQEGYVRYLTDPQSLLEEVRRAMQDAEKGD